MHIHLPLDWSSFKIPLGLKTNFFHTRCVVFFSNWFHTANELVRWYYSPLTDRILVQIGIADQYFVGCIFLLSHYIDLFNNDK